MDEKTIKIEEFFFPIFCDDDSEIAIEIDDFIIECLKKYKYAFINKKIINFENEVEYEYEEGNIMDLLVQEKNNNGLFMIPSEDTINLIESEISIKISIIKNYLVLNDECGKLFKFKMKQINSNEELQEQNFNSKDIINIFKNNTNRLCKVYVTTDFPVCFEFLNYRIFISPLD